jgi:hypothetical protein
MKEQTEYRFADEIVVTAQDGLDLVTIGRNTQALVVKPNSPVILKFPEPAWYVLLRSRTSTSSLRAKAYSRGKLRLSQSFSGASVEWFTRGIEHVELTGDGQIVGISYRLACAKNAKWTHLKHFCLPVSDPAYPCGPRTWGNDEAEAKSRLPLVVQSSDWATEYQPTFRSMRPTLTAVATHRPVPPFPPSTDPDAPALDLTPEAGLQIAMLDPHVARMLGTAYDDALAPTGLDGKWYAYKIAGRWACETKTVAGESLDPDELEDRHGIVVAHQAAKSTFRDGILHTKLSADGLLRFRFPTALETLSLCAGTEQTIAWVARDAEGRKLREGKVPTGLATGASPNINIQVAGVRSLEFTGQGSLDVLSFWWRTPPYIERVGVLPGILATGASAPVGPDWITAVVEQPAQCNGPIQALLDWETKVLPGGIARPEEAIFYQVAGTQISNDPAATAPATPMFRADYALRDGDFIIVRPDIAAAPSPRTLLIDRHDGTGLKEGWRVWWARGVDLFGRASAPSEPDVRRVEDVAAPPAPVLVLAEYVQGDLPDTGARVLSAVGRQWLAANANGKALVVAWAWTPELDQQCPDVDGFKCYTRHPVATTGGAEDEAATTYEGVGWGSAIGSLGPSAVHFDGIVNSVQSGLGTILVSRVQPLETDAWALSTDVTLDVGAGALTGGTLTSGALTYDIIGNGDGVNLTIYVKAAGGAGAPTNGSYTLQSTAVARIATTIAPPADPATFQRRFGGVLSAGTDRFLVLRDSGGSFIVRVGSSSPPVTSAAISWYPAYVFVITDTGIGPQPSLTVPVAYGQITATSVRRWSTRPVESPPASPGPLTAVDATVPATPAAPVIPSGAFCAELATRPDWYGISRYTMEWTPNPALTYTVYRALGDAIVKLDTAYHDQSIVRAHSFPSATWPVEIWDDVNGRRAAVNSDFTTLDTDLAPAFTIPKDDLTRRDQRRALIEAAYSKLHADAQQVIANQDHVRPAYVARNKLPLEPSELPYVDEFDGRAKARWFYRVASRTPAGIESAWTTASPPICPPDVVPPTAPQVQVALAANEQLKLRWIASPERDVAKYLVYRAPDELGATDVRTMTHIASVAPAPTGSPPAGLQSPTAVTGKTGWLEFAAPAAPAGEWFFRFVAEDERGNRSAQSAILRGRSLRSPPAPPVWSNAQRAPAANPTHVELTWSHASDARLACRVERRIPGLPVWGAASEWLPRGAYAFTDTPSQLGEALEYRLKVLDQLGQSASTAPTITLPALP